MQNYKLIYQGLKLAVDFYYQYSKIKTICRKKSKMKKDNFQILGLIIGITLIVVNEIIDLGKHKGEEKQ